MPEENEIELPTGEQPRSLIVRMKIEFGYESIIQLKKDFDELSPKDRQDMVDNFNAIGKPTKL
jgi:hypothetical protein